jgi:hypothetical protein
VLTALIVKAAANPQIIPIMVPESKPPVHHSTPRPTSKDTTTKTITDKITVPAILANNFAPLTAYSLRSCTRATRTGHCSTAPARTYAFTSETPPTVFAAVTHLPTPFVLVP